MQAAKRSCDRCGSRTPDAQVNPLSRQREQLANVSRCRVFIDAIVFVVDSVDVERMEEAKMELMRTAKSPDNSQVPILILANKQDLPGARDPKEIEKHLGLHELGTGHLYHVQPACAITGEGLDDGLDALYDMIQKRKKNAKMARNKNKIAK